MMALKNEQINRNVDTVLFFDEANTCEALGMIKEIMVDRRCNGRPLSDRLKFIVACNPYRRQVQGQLIISQRGYLRKEDRLVGY